MLPKSDITHGSAALLNLLEGFRIPNNNNKLPNKTRTWQTYFSLHALCSFKQKNIEEKKKKIDFGFNPYFF